MTVAELKIQPGDAETVAKRPFQILKELAALFNKSSDGDTLPEQQCRDLVLRALEHRKEFGSYQPVLDSLVRELGLFPYLEEQSLSLMDSIAYEYHRPALLEDSLVFHREQAEVYRNLLAGESIILSAPTSFGKSKVIDAMIACKRYANIAVIVPTIALIDETRRRLSRFSSDYKIVTQVSQVPGDRNVFVFTAERANVYTQLPRIEFFVIDEFYKIGAVESDQKRTAALNQAFYTLSKGGGQFYLLGPNVRQIPEGLEQRFRCRFFPTAFSTVASDLIPVKKTSKPLTALAELVKRLRGEPTLIYCKSPASTNDVVDALLTAKSVDESVDTDAAARWMQKNFHAEWILPRAIKHGIGLHHGRLPRSLGQFVVRAFNEGRINVLACTSTLIEGVNTKAKNVIIFDNTIAKEKLDFFTFNNIKGRSGRMFQHFVGRVYLFHEPPQEELPFVDFPLFTQTSSAPNSLLLQIDSSDLTAKSKDRVEAFHRQKVLPMVLLKAHSSIEPENLLNLATHIKGAPLSDRRLLSWQGFPKYDNLKAVCQLVWVHLLNERGMAGVFSGSQLTLKLSKLRNTPDIRARILAELEPGKFAAKTVDSAVERVLEFDRTWASFEMPRLLRAAADVHNHVVGGGADYAYYAGQLENLFRQPFQIALEEFGLPLQVSDKLASRLRGADSIDHALAVLKRLEPMSLDLDRFERELVAICQQDL